MKKIKDFSKHLIKEELSLLGAMDLLNSSALEFKTLFVVRDNKLVGSVSDGDIRRWVLKSGSLNACAKDFANPNPKFVYEGELEKAKSIFRYPGIVIIPAVNEEKEIVGLLIEKPSNEVEMQKKIDVPVVIMAGGAGTRLYPYTKILPKPLIPIGDDPIIVRIINFFKAQGCHRFYMIVNHKKNMIKAYFSEDMHPDYELTFIDEDIPLGTGGGLSLLQGMINEPFILTNCDNIINVDFSDVLKRHTDSGSAITVLSSVQKVVIPYGVIHLGDEGYIEKMEEKPTLPYLINTGCYVVNPEVVNSLEVGARIDFPTIIANRMGLGDHVGVYPINSEDFLDMGQFDQMERMKNVLHIKD